MAEQPISCEFVDQLELDHRYLEGKLPEAEASAFEAHYFGCDRCWELVKGGAGLRAARHRDGAAPAVRPRRWWQPLAVAAGIGLAALGTWRATAPRSPARADALRGAEESLAVGIAWSDGAWHTTWPAARDAVSYRVRLFAGDGRLLFTRQVTDTGLALAADSLLAIGQGAPLYLEVEGFDLLGRSVARSPLSRLGIHGNPP